MILYFYFKKLSFLLFTVTIHRIYQLWKGTWRSRHVKMLMIWRPTWASSNCTSLIHNFTRRILLVIYFWRQWQISHILTSFCANVCWINSRYVCMFLCYLFIDWLNLQTVNCGSHRTRAIFFLVRWPCPHSRSSRRNIRVALISLVSFAVFFVCHLLTMASNKFISAPDEILAEPQKQEEASDVNNDDNINENVSSKHEIV